MTRHPNTELDRRTLIQASLVGTAVAATTGGAGAAAPPPPRSGKTGRLGSGLSRLDGGLKVTGQARYAIEQSLEGLLYGVIVSSTIPSGRVRTIDADAARRAAGVVAVFTHESGLKIHQPRRNFEGGAATEKFAPLQDDRVRWNGQHIALVVAETFEAATDAATRIAVTYEESEPRLHPWSPGVTQQPQKDLDVEWGDANAALASAPVKMEAVYTTPREYNVPMEPHACIAAWADGKLTVWEPSQWVGGARQVISEFMGMPIDDVRVISPFVGGGFGSKISPHGHVALACAASRALKRPVKVSLTRPQTFTGLGGRPRTRQKLALGATREGKLLSIVHEGYNETAIDDLHTEPTNVVTAIMYATPNFWSRHSVAPVNTVNPSWMRAPGENPSAFALETAIDELAHQLGLDPLELRLRNWADQDPQARVPWSSRRLKEAYAEGAKAFGWSKRKPAPRSMREGRELIGWGMAAGTYPVRRTPAEAEVVVRADGSVEVRSSGVDIGTGTYTILAQVAAEALGVPVGSVTVKLGDTTLPRSPLAGGSQLANLLAGAVHKTALAARAELLSLAADHPASPVKGAKFGDLTLQDGHIRPARRPAGGVTIAALLKAVGRGELVAHQDTFKPGATEQDRQAADRTFSQMLAPTDGGLSAHSWCAHFVEVRVDEDFGTVRVKRMVGAFDSGRIYNAKLARSQWVGGMIMGIGQALLEEGFIDPRDGRILNANLADYVVPVNADIPDIQTIDVGAPDLAATALGGKAVGELGIVGVAAAIGNAVFHATGKRVRDLPITLEKLV